MDSILLEKGFKRGDIKEVSQTSEKSASSEKFYLEVDKAATSQIQEHESVIPLKTVNEEPLALIYVEKDELHVLPDESKSFSVKTAPFSNFLVERILTKMQEKDSELVRMGELATDKMFAYNIVCEGDFIREIIFKNVDEERLRELKSSIRWTFEKMYEKTKQ